MKNADARRLRRRHTAHSRYLWWPISATWGGNWTWFHWHWIEASRNYPAPASRHFQTWAQVFHLGKFKIVFGRWKSQ